MNIQAVILVSAVAFVAAGCGCGEAPIQAQAGTNRPAAAKQSAPQVFVDVGHAPVSPIRGAPNPQEQPYQLEAPGTPPTVAANTQFIAGSSVTTGQIAAPPPVTQASRPPLVSKAPAMKLKTRERRVDGRAWNTIEGGERAGPASKASRSASSDIMGPS